MLPSSHVLPINAGLASIQGNLGQAAPVQPSSVLSGPAVLADAFSEFISASAQLEASYRELQQEVSRLDLKLAEQNAALTSTLNENKKMRAALEQILDSMPCGVLVLDTTEAIVMINPEGRSLLNLGKTRIRSLRQLSAACSIDFEELAVASSVQDSAAQADNEVCLASEAGKRWIAIGRRRLTGAPHAGSFGKDAPLESIWILRDVTAMRQAEEARESARKMIALAEAAAILAHEIRNPLASMELFAGLIAEDPGQTAQWVSHLRAGIRQLSGTVNNILSLRSGGELHRVAVDLVACIAGGVEFVRPIADQAGVALLFEALEASLQILADENVVRQIVLNLISNAIRHTASGGVIQVAVHAAARGEVRRAVVAIQDSGCGIPEEWLTRIFDAGFSGSGATPGLGLAVCQRLMLAHDGEIRVASRTQPGPNQGTTFELEFSTL